MIKIKKYQIEDYISDATQDALDLKADLVDGKVPASQLPSFVDDVIEVVNYAALPIPGATGVIYITLDTNKVYRWTGSVYVEIASGVTNLSYTPGVSNGTVNSDTGSDAIIPLAGTVNAGLFSAAEKSKLDGIAPNANVGVIPNAPITGATKTKITYDTKGLVTAGADATTADIADSTNKRYVTDANLTVINNTSGTNTGDQGLQSVTDIGASTDNTITINTINANGLNINTSGVDPTKSAMILTSTISDGTTFSSYSYNGSVANYFYSDAGDCIALQADYPFGLGLNITSLGGGISAYSIAYPVVELYQTLTNKGLVINSGTSSTGNFIELAKNSVNKLTVNQAGELTAQKLIKDGGFDFQFLKADGSVDNNTYLTSADLPSTLDLYATTSPDPVISGYTALVRNITDPRYDTVAVDVPTPLVNGTIASPTFCGAVISDPSVLLGNPGAFNFTVIGNIRRVSGSTSSGADFFYSIYKRDLAGTETFIAEGAKVPVPANGGLYIEYISTALWNDGIFLSTDRIVLKFYGIQTGGGTGAYYEFLFGGGDPVRGTASISSAIIPNIYLRDLADVEKTPALDNEILYWNDAASLWEHSLVVDLTPDASATQKGLVSTGAQTFAGEKTFNTNPKIPVNGGNSGAGAIVLDDGAGQIQVASNSIYPNTTELTYVKGVTSSIQTQLNGKQATLVSGTNIRTVNGSTLLGSTNLSVGTVTSVTGTAPVVSSGGTTPAISMAAATGSVDGYLTSANWTTFNDKLDANTWIDYSSISTIVGWSVYTTKTIKYTISGKLMFIQYNILGLSNNSATSFTLPFSSPASSIQQSNNNISSNNNTIYMGYGLIGESSSLVTFRYFTTAAAQTAIWTASGNKSVRGILILEIA